MGLHTYFGLHIYNLNIMDVKRQFTNEIQQLCHNIYVYSGYKLKLIVIHLE